MQSSLCIENYIKINEVKQKVIFRHISYHQPLPPFYFAFGLVLVTEVVENKLVFPLTEIIDDWRFYVFDHHQRFKEHHYYDDYEVNFQGLDHFLFPLVHVIHYYLSRSLEFFDRIVSMADYINQHSKV